MDTILKMNDVFINDANYDAIINESFLKNNYFLIEELKNNVFIAKIIKYNEHSSNLHENLDHSEYIVRMMNVLKKSIAIYEEIYGKICMTHCNTTTTLFVEKCIEIMNLKKYDDHNFTFVNVHKLFVDLTNELTIYVPCECLYFYEKK